MTGCWRLVGFVVLLTLSAAHAQVADTSARAEAREHYKKGSLAYELGHYDAAITEYEACYALVSDPALLWNLGQAHKQLGHDEEALHFYRTFLQKLPNAPNRSEAEAKIAAIQISLAEQDARKRAMPVTPPPTAVQIVETYRAPQTTDHTRRPMIIAGLTLGIAGLGLVGGGIATAILSQHASDDVSRANTTHGVYSPSDYSTFKTDRIVSGVLLGVGGAALVSGITLGIIGLKKGHPRELAWQVAPTLAPTQAGVTVMKRF